MYICIYIYRERERATEREREETSRWTPRSAEWRAPAHLDSDQIAFFSALIYASAHHNPVACGTNEGDVKPPFAPLLDAAIGRVARASPSEHNQIALFSALNYIIR